MPVPRSTATAWWGRVAAGWCTAFALVHVFWALGGSAGLASAAGSELASQRPTAFVVLGLWGTALVLLLGAALALFATSTVAADRVHRAAALVVLAAGGLLVVRALAVEVLLLLAPRMREAVGPRETFWSLVGWNPWFLLGGLLLLAAGIAARCTSR